MVQRFFFASLFVGALLGTGHPALAQTPPPDAAAAAAAVAEIRQTIDAAWKDVQAYRSGGGKPATPDHPALKWHATLWAYREQHPGTEAAARATADAIRLLVRGEFWEQAHAPRPRWLAPTTRHGSACRPPSTKRRHHAQGLRVHACHALEGCGSHDVARPSSRPCSSMSVARGDGRATWPPRRSRSTRRAPQRQAPHHRRKPTAFCTKSHT